METQCQSIVASLEVVLHCGEQSGRHQLVSRLLQVVPPHLCAVLQPSQRRNLCFCQLLLPLPLPLPQLRSPLRTCGLRKHGLGSDPRNDQQSNYGEISSHCFILPRSEEQTSEL